MNQETIRKMMMKKLNLLIVCISAVVVLVLVFASVKWIQHEKREPVIKTISTLEKIVKISDLSTYTAVYNGIATVTDPEDTEKVRYYVSYKATVNAGLDFGQINMQDDQEKAQIVVTLPEIRLQEPVVDVGSLEYIFLDNKANQSTITAEALTACNADADAESREQKAILELAEQNAINVLRALMEPVMEQELPDYQLEFVSGEAQS